MRVTKARSTTRTPMRPLESEELRLGHSKYKVIQADSKGSVTGPRAPTCPFHAHDRRVAGFVESTSQYPRNIQPLPVGRGPLLQDAGTAPGAYVGGAHLHRCRHRQRGGVEVPPRDDQGGGGLSGGRVHPGAGKEKTASAETTRFGLGLHLLESQNGTRHPSARFAVAKAPLPFPRRHEAVRSRSSIAHRPSRRQSLPSVPTVPRLPRSSPCSRSARGLTLGQHENGRAGLCPQPSFTGPGGSRGKPGVAQHQCGGIWTWHRPAGTFRANWKGKTWAKRGPPGGRR